MDDLDRGIPGAPDGGISEPPRPQEWLESKMGLRFDLHADEWPLTSKINLQLGPLRERLAAYPLLLEGAIRTLAFFAQNRAARTCHNNKLVLIRFLKSSPPTEEAIIETAVTSFRQMTINRDGHDGNGLQNLRPFLDQWHALGYPGVSGELVERMEGWTLKKMELYSRVNNRDPNGGPLTSPEQHAVQVGAMRAFEEGTISLRDYSVYRLFDLSGRRLEQLVQLKLKDLDESRTEDARPGEPAGKLLLLHVPRIKAKRKWRAHFRAIPLTSDEWNLLVLLRAEVIREFDTRLADTGLVLQPHDRAAIHGELPLFIGILKRYQILDDISALTSVGEHGKAITLLRTAAASDALEMNGRNISVALDKVIAAAAVNNTAGKVLTVFPTRFRYTLVANLERLGCPHEVIAWNLDHDTLRSLPSYAKNGADRAARLSKATLTQMQRLAGFYGFKVVDNEADAVGGDDPDQSRLFIANTQGGATCAIKRGCHMGSIPRACYDGCKHFQPWVDGPHGAFLEQLLGEREEVFTRLDPVKERATIEAADQLILCVAAVIHLCEERRRELAAQAQTRRPTRRGIKQ